MYYNLVPPSKIKLNPRVCYVSEVFATLFVTLTYEGRWQCSLRARARLLN